VILGWPVLGSFVRHGEMHFAYKAEMHPDGWWVYFFKIDGDGALLRCPAEWR
jgi:hypothetical protein